MAKRKIARLLSVSLLLIVITSLVTACRDPLSHVIEPPARFSLEVVNDSGEPIWVQIEIRNSEFPSSRYVDGILDDSLGRKATVALPVAPRNSCGRPSIARSPILALDTRESMVLPVMTYTSPCGAGSPRGDETNVFVRQFGSIHYLGIAPVTSYVYWLTECIGFFCSHPGDDTMVLHVSSDGTIEQLFLESSDRPFYLERDTENRQLARLVITFVPTPGSASVSDGFGAEDSIGR